MKLNRTIIAALFVLLFISASSFAEKSKLPPELDRSYKLAENWFLNSINEKGIFNYIYDSHLDSYSTTNNAIRQLMSSRLLAEMAASDPSLRAKHQKNLDFIFKNWILRKEKLSFVYLFGKSKLGANAMMLRTLVASPFYEKYREEAERFKSAIFRTMDSDGSFYPFLVEPSYKYDRDYLNTFYTGEALVALIEYYQKEKDEAAFLAAKLAQNFYIKKYVRDLDKNYYPAYVPWHTISLNLLYKITKNKEYADAIFVLNDKLLEMLDRSDHVGRFFNPATPQYGNPHASSDGVYTEGLSYALEIARIVGDKKRMASYQSALDIAFRHLVSLQYTEANSSHLPTPKRSIGAFRIRRTKKESPFSERPGSNIRIDSVQHTMDAFRKYAVVRSAFAGS